MVARSLGTYGDGHQSGVVGVWGAALRREPLTLFCFSSGLTWCPETAIDLGLVPFAGLGTKGTETVYSEIRKADPGE